MIVSDSSDIDAAIVSIPTGPPPVRDYPQVEKSVRDALAALGPREVLEKLIW